MQDQLHSTKPINLPVRPPIRFRALLADLAAPVMMGLAEDVTRDKPSEAFDVATEVAAAALEAPVDAA